MRTKDPDYIDAFVETCINNGLDENQATELYKQACREDVMRDPDFVEGFSNGINKVAFDTMDPSGITAGFDPLTKSVATYGGLGTLAGTLASLFPKFRGAKALAAGTGALGGSAFGYLKNKFYDEPFHDVAVNKVAIPYWMDDVKGGIGGGSSAGSGGVNDYHWLHKGNSSNRPSGLIHPHIAGMRKRVSEIDSQIAEAERGMATAAGGLRGAMSRSENNRLLNSLREQRADLIEQLGGSVSGVGASINEFKRTKAEQLANLNKWRAYTADQEAGLASALNAETSPTLGGWFRRQVWNPLTGVGARAADVQGRLASMKRYEDYLNSVENSIGGLD